ncbi:MAG: YajQ family cyclic di-GMP-binding protein [Patescibacteria group bacterium]
MPAEFSFDIVSEIDQQELVNALDQTKREIANRFDFKGLNIEINLEKDHLIILVPSEFKLTAVIDILKSKLLRREIDLRILGEMKTEPASGGSIRANIPLVQGISQDSAKLINKILRDALPKIKSVIQGDTLRVSSKSKDDLQTVMNLLRQTEAIKLPLQFINYR